MLLQQLHLAPGPARVCPHGRRAARQPSWICRTAEATTEAPTAAADAPPPQQQQQQQQQPLQSYIQESASYSPAELAARIGIRARLPALRNANRASSYLRRAAQSSQLAADSVLAAAAESAASAAASSYTGAATAYQGYDYSTYEEDDYAAVGGEGGLEGEDGSSSSSYTDAWADMDPGQEGYEYAASDSDSEDLVASVDASFGGYLDPEGWVFTPDGEYAEYEYAEDWKNHNKSGLAKYEDGTPLPEKLDGLSTEDKVKPLQRMQAICRSVMQSELKVAESHTGNYFSTASKTIDLRLYQQLVTAHNKQSEKLHELEKFIKVQEDVISEKNNDLADAYDLLKSIGMEYGTTGRMAQSAIAAVQYAVDPADATDKVAKLQARLLTLEKGVKELRTAFRKKVVQKVPVEWVGVATEVRVVGDFDGWTRGVDLSQAQEDVMSDSVYARFEGNLLLRPGVYRVKLLVDGEWRLASDWPTEKDKAGNTVNLLTVT